MDIKLPALVVATPEKVKAETLSTVPTSSLNQVNAVESGNNEENVEEHDDDDDDWDTFQSFPASTNLEGSESKTESLAEEEPSFPGTSSIQEDESNETNNSLLAEEADDQHLASDRSADTTGANYVDKGKGVVEEDTVEPCLIEEALTSQNDKTSSDDHHVEMKEESAESKSWKPENTGIDIKLPSTEADTPAPDDTSDNLEPQQFQKSVGDDQVKSSNEHVG